MSKEIVKGSVVKFEGGFYRVTSARGSKVNLGAIFGGRIYHKGVAVTAVCEAHDEWYAYWQQTDAYRCM